MIVYKEGKLIENTKNEVHKEIVLDAAYTQIFLDNGLEVRPNDNNEYETKITSLIKAVEYIPVKLFQLIQQ